MATRPSHRSLPADDVPEACPSDYRIDLLLAGELDRRAESEVREHITSCSSCHMRLLEFESQIRSFGSVPRPARASTQTVVLGGPSWSVLALAGGAALFLFAILRHTAPAAPPTPAYDHDTGYSLALAHDQRVVYSSLEPRYLTVLGVARGGAVSVLYPAGPQARLAPAGREIALDRVADGGEAEILLGFFCQRPVSPGEISARVRARPAATQPPEGCESASWRALETSQR